MSGTKFRALLLACVLLAGCADLSTETRIEEFSFQTLNAIDTVQTVKMTYQPLCFQEAGELHINGYHPSAHAVMEYGAALALLHFGITELLQHTEDADENAIMTRIWEVSSIGIDGLTGAYHNYRFFGDRIWPRDPGCWYQPPGQTGAWE